MPAPLRILHNTSARLDSERVECLTTVSPTLTAGTVVLGIAGLLIAALVPVSAHGAPLMLSLVLAPACGALLASVLLFFYDRKVMIHVPEGRVIRQERMFRLPLNTVERSLEDFDRLVVAIQSPGRESHPGNYCTLVLKGPDAREALFDMEDYTQAREVARELASVLQVEDETGL